MDTLVRMKADEISNSMVDFIKSSFKGKKIAVHIYEDGEEDEIDETTYLLSSEANKKKLFQSIENVKNNISVKEYSFEEIEQILNKH